MQSIEVGNQEEDAMKGDDALTRILLWMIAIASWTIVWSLKDLNANVQQLNQHLDSIERGNSK